MILIPARLASTRFPEKILAPIGSVPMVAATARRVKNIDDVVVATDSEKVFLTCKKYSVQAVLTSTTHKSGTDRINEAADILKLNDDEIIINVQADEPFIEPDIVQKVYTKVQTEKEALMVSAYKSVSKTLAMDPNLVKVVVDTHGYALYFSRSLIPYDRDTCKEYCGHLGLYGFKRNNLQTFCLLNEAPLEKIEKLEQLRALYNGYKIAMIKVNSESFGIDTQEDYQRASKLFNN